jgi:hypothetical protein
MSPADLCLVTVSPDPDPLVLDLTSARGLGAKTELSIGGADIITLIITGLPQAMFVMMGDIWPSLITASFGIGMLCRQVDKDENKRVQRTRIPDILNLASRTCGVCAFIIGVFSDLQVDIRSMK